MRESSRRAEALRDDEQTSQTAVCRRTLGAYAPVRPSPEAWGAVLGFSEPGGVDSGRSSGLPDLDLVAGVNSMRWQLT